jgi:NADH pyrophosphatase NudC (nudix superfamily)
MPKHDAELKARLLAEAEAAIDQMLKTRRTASHASLADIEQVARSTGQQVAQAVTSALTAESAAELPAWPNCPQCGRKMKNKGKHTRRLVTETGEVEVERAYYHCAACHQGFFPPG